MRIITVYIPEAYLKIIDSLIGHTGVYPSRSELIRVAVREFLIKELAIAEEFVQFPNPPSVAVSAQVPSDDAYIRIPVNPAQTIDGNPYKIYRIVKK